MEAMDKCYLAVCFFWFVQPSVLQNHLRDGPSHNGQGIPTLRTNLENVLQTCLTAQCNGGICSTEI